jgi:hypothetical protein
MKTKLFSFVLMFTAFVNYAQQDAHSIHVQHHQYQSCSMPDQEALSVFATPTQCTQD